MADKLTEILAKNPVPLPDQIFVGEITQHDVEGYFRIYPNGQAGSYYVIVRSEDVVGEPLPWSNEYVKKGHSIIVKARAETKRVPIAG